MNSIIFRLESNGEVVASSIDESMQMEVSQDEYLNYMNELVYADYNNQLYTPVVLKSVIERGIKLSDQVFLFKYIYWDSSHRQFDIARNALTPEIKERAEARAKELRKQNLRIVS